MKKVLYYFVSICVVFGLMSSFMISASAESVIPGTSITSIEAGENSFTVNWEKTGKKVNYQIQYVAGKFKNDKIKKVNIKNNTITSKTIKNISYNKKYKVRIRTYKKVKSKKYFSAWSKVKTIKLVKLKKISVTPNSRTMQIGEQIQLETTFKPSNTSYKDVVYSSSNADVAFVSENGLVTAKAGGTANIKVKVKDTKISKKVKITVVIPANGVKITNTKGIKIEKNKKLTLSATVFPQNTTEQKIIWRSSDKTKATVDSNGVVTALRPTEYVLITATTQNKKYSDSYILQITDNSGYLTKSKLDSLNLLTTNNLMIVAHPDDETFWGGAHLFNSDYLINKKPFNSEHLLNSNYLVVVMTNSYNKTRSDDFNKIMSATNDKGLILSYPDVRKSWIDSNKQYKYEADNWTTCKTGAQKDIELLLNYKKWDLVVTHNPDGEYGKSHHKIVNNIVSNVYNSASNKLNSDTPLFYFGHYYDSKINILAPQISESDAVIKNQLLALYSNNVSGAKNAFGHMMNYENWILSTDWDEAKKNKFNFDYFNQDNENEENSEPSKTE